MTTDTPITAAAYADLVRAELTDLPPDDLASMVEGLDAHLAEIAADGQADLVAALGAPAAYAAELRSAAGLPARARATFLPPAPPVARRRVWSAPSFARAAIALAVAAAVVAVVVVHEHAGVLRLCIVIAAVAAVWGAVSLLVGRAGLPGRWLAGGRALIAVAAVATAATLGAMAAGASQGASSQPVPDWPNLTIASVLLPTTVVPGVSTATAVQVANCSAQNGVAEMMSSVLTDAGFMTAEPTLGTCDPKLTSSYVIFDEGVPGAADVAATLAETLGLHAEPAALPIKVQSGAWADGSGVVLLLGNDIAGMTLGQIQGTPLGGTVLPWTTSTTIAVIQP